MEKRSRLVSYLFTNGMVMTLDQRCEQMEEFQGQYGEVVNKILDTPGGAEGWALVQWMPGGVMERLALFTPIRI